MKRYLWVLIIIFLPILTIAADFHPMAPATTSFSELNSTPSYTIIPIPATLSTDPGKTINVDVYIAGMGNIKNNKLVFYYPNNLLNSENPGRVGTTIACITDTITNVETPTIKDNSVPLTGIVGVNLVSCNFMYENNTLRLMSEAKNNGVPPIYLTLNVAKNATPGDRDVGLFFIYTDGIKWYQDREKITIHVNNPVEENRTHLLIILAFLAVPWFSNYTKNKYKQILSSRFGIIVETIQLGLVLYIFYLGYNSL